MSIRCGNTSAHMDREVVHHHETVAQVRLCFFRSEGLPSLEEEMAAQEWADEYRNDPDRAYERHLETNETAWLENEQARLVEAGIVPPPF